MREWLAVRQCSVVQRHMCSCVQVLAGWAGTTSSVLTSRPRTPTAARHGECAADARYGWRGAPLPTAHPRHRRRSGRGCWKLPNTSGGRCPLGAHHRRMQYAALAWPVVVLRQLPQFRHIMLAPSRSRPPPVSVECSMPIHHFLMGMPGT
jgi:hypothetical protein